MWWIMQSICRPNDLNLLLIMKLTETVSMITTPFTQTDWLSTSNLFFILPLSYIFSSKKIFIVISVMRERVGSIHDTFNLYLASWWSICSCNLHLSLQLLISVFNCAEIFFHESGYFMAKVSIIQSNLDENNLLFLPLILKRFTLFFQVKNSQFRDSCVLQLFMR